MTLLERIRLRAFAWVLGLTLAAVGVIIFAAQPILPVVGVTIAAFAFVVRAASGKIGETACRGCGTDLSGHASGAYGIACPACGTLNQVLPPDDALMPDAMPFEPDPADGDRLA